MRAVGLLSIALLLSACASFIDSRDKPKLFEDTFSGEHAALAACTASKLQNDGRAFLRLLQIRNRHYPEIGVSEIHAYDTRYLRGAYAAYAPSNPDGVLLFGEPAAEIQSPAQRGQRDQAVYAFALTLQQTGGNAVTATLKGEPFIGKIAWQIAQRCATSAANP